MRIIEPNENIDIKQDVYVALGSFDGIHRGHLSLIEEVKAIAKQNNGISAILTFTKHPLEEIASSKAPKLLMENEYKYEVFQNLQIDLLIMKKFDKDFMKKTPEEFVKMLIEEYNVKGIVVGFNFKFGYKNQGDVESLSKLSKKYDFKLKIMTPYLYKEDVISSTRIRSSLENGDATEVREMLSRPYLLEGVVVHGKKNGRKFGFPTANIEVSKKLVIPKKGVYYCNVLYNNNIYRAITSIGSNPTVNGDKLTIEPHILDFDKEIYGEKIKLYFLSKMRDEKKFNSIDELIAQLKNDATWAKDRELIT